MPPSQQNAVDVTADVCARSCGLFMVAMALTGAVLAFASFTGCKFLILNFSGLPPNITAGNTGGRLLDDCEHRLLDQPIFNETMYPSPSPSSPSPSPSLAPSLGPTATLITSTTRTLGMFKYFDEADGVCYYYNSTTILQTPLQIRVARLGSASVAIASLVATGILLLEYCFCRFYCARAIVSAMSVFVLLGAPTAFVVFFDPRCRTFTNFLNICAQGQNADAIITAERGQGANALIAAATLYLATLILLCFTPKAVPIIRVMDTIDCQALDSSGWCACCIIPSRRRDTKDVIVPDEEVELIQNEDGHTFKQYHDEMAGLTFQNQYTAAYKRWLAFEADYETTLARFKEDCEEADVNWRVFLRKARMRERGGTFEDEPSMATDDEEQHLDEELIRFVGVLNTLRRNCDFAQEVMERIQKDINDQAQHEDEIKRRQAEEAFKKNSKKNTWESLTNPKGHQEEGVDATESQSKVGTIFSKLSHQLKGISSHSTVTKDQDGDMFKSARMGPRDDDILNPTSSRMGTRDGDISNPASARTGNRDGDIFGATRVNVAQDDLSMGVNESFVPSQHDRIEEEPPTKEKRPVADFVLGVTGIEWALNKVRHHDDDGSTKVELSAS